MCLGIPAEVISGDAGHPDLVMARRGGVERAINIAILDRRPRPGELVMVHMGCALEFMTAEEAADATSLLSDDVAYFDGLLARRVDDAGQEAERA